LKNLDSRHPEPEPLSWAESGRFWEFALLGMMLLTSFIGSDFSPITPWTDINPLSWIRGIVWVSGLTILPGYYILRFTGFWAKIEKTTKVVFAIHLSLLVVGLSILGLYTLHASLNIFPWLMIFGCFSLGALCWSRPRVQREFKNRPISLLDWALIAIVATVVLIALLVQVAQRYLVPGDVWVSTQPAIQILSGRDVYEAFRPAQYPIMFGFILAGLSVGSGLPPVNTYVLLFSLGALNPLAFFLLAKTLLGSNNRIAILSTFVYSLGGGLAFLIQTLVYHGTLDFWNLSLVTQDIYFFPFFWNDVQFFYKSLSLTLCFVSLVAFRLSFDIRQRTSLLLAALSALFMLFSFLIHMIDVIIFLPLIVVITILYGRPRKSYTNLWVFLLTFGFCFSVLDSMMLGYYVWLTTAKVGGVLVGTVDLGLLVRYPEFIVPFCLAFMGILVVLKRRTFAQPRVPSMIKFLCVGVLGLIYSLGLLYWQNTPQWSPSLELSTPFPWVSYVTRYGFVGALALLGVGASRWTRSLTLSSVWAILSIFAGSVWWGTRMNAYLFPVLAIWAGVGITSILNKSNSALANHSISSTRRFWKLYQLRPKRALVVGGSVCLILLSFTSAIYGALYYVSSGTPTSDDMAKVIAWIHQATPENSTILVPPVYSISKGILTLADRTIYLTSNLPQVLDTDSFVNVTTTLLTHDIRYVVNVRGFDEPSEAVRVLLLYSTAVFSSGNIEVLKLPALAPPSGSSMSTVAVVDENGLGLLGVPANFGWFDDGFTSDWHYVNANATSDGQVLTYGWTFRSGITQEPAAYRQITPTSTDFYPYLIIRYRNTLDTSSTAENNVGQIVTLANSSGLPLGYISNIYLPLSIEGYRVFAVRLPPDQTVGYLNIWMRNYKQLSGAIGLQIDYIALSSSTDVLPEDLRFISMAIPALWPTRYSISDNLSNMVSANLIVTTYNQSFPNYVGQLSPHDYLLINATASVPSWGSSWTQINDSIVVGQIEGRQVVIFGLTDSNLSKGGSLETLAYYLFELVMQGAF